MAAKRDEYSAWTKGLPPFLRNVIDTATAVVIFVGIFSSVPALGWLWRHGLDQVVWAAAPWLILAWLGLGCVVGVVILFGCLDAIDGKRPW